MNRIRVLIVDDHAILRDGIRSLLDRQEDLEVVGEACNGREGVEQVEKLKPDIVLMDIAMPVMNGLEATQQIKKDYPEVKVLILTQHDNREYVAPLLQAGASGYVLKRSGGREVVMAIREVYSQGAYLEPSVARKVLEEIAAPQETTASTVPYLTEREREVLKLVVEGKSNKEIGAYLGISPKTVSVHRSNVMMKFEVQNTVELVRYVQQHRMFENSSS